MPGDLDVADFLDRALTVGVGREEIAVFEEVAALPESSTSGPSAVQGSGKFRKEQTEGAIVLRSTEKQRGFSKSFLDGREVAMWCPAVNLLEGTRVHRVASATEVSRAALLREFLIWPDSVTEDCAAETMLLCAGIEQSIE